jgi:glycosyltransferase involved in cell wall biosynthesis
MSGENRPGAAQNQISENKRIDTKVILDDKSEILLFAKIKNESLRIEHFLEWYRQLGVARFFFIDNESNDGTLEILLNQPDCHVFQNAGNMGHAKAGIDWITHLLNEYGTGHWCVIADADELLVYQDYEKEKLSVLCGRLRGNGFDAFHCMLIDMYPVKSGDAKAYSAGQPFLKFSSLFDRKGYSFDRHEDGNITVKGGPRARLFYSVRMARITRFALRVIRAGLPVLKGTKLLKSLEPKFPPSLNKVPLVYWNASLSYADGAHYLYNAKIAAETGALLHFKFLGDFAARIGNATLAAAYFNQGEEYKRYNARLKSQDDIRFQCNLTVPFKGSRQLIDLGLIRPSEAPRSIEAKRLLGK